MHRGVKVNGVGMLIIVLCLCLILKSTCYHLFLHADSKSSSRQSNRVGKEVRISLWNWLKKYWFLWRLLNLSNVEVGHNVFYFDLSHGFREFKLWLLLFDYFHCHLEIEIPVILLKLIWPQFWHTYFPVFLCTETFLQYNLFQIYSFLRHNYLRLLFGEIDFPNWLSFSIGNCADSLLVAFVLLHHSSIIKVNHWWYFLFDF